MAVRLWYKSKNFVLSLPLSDIATTTTYVVRVLSITKVQLYICYVQIPVFTSKTWVYTPSLRIEATLILHVNMVQALRFCGCRSTLLFCLKLVSRYTQKLKKACVFPGLFHTKHLLKTVHANMAKHSQKAPFHCNQNTTFTDRDMTELKHEKLLSQGWKPEVNIPLASYRTVVSPRFLNWSLTEKNT